MSSIHVLENHYRTFPHVRSSWSEPLCQQLPLTVNENKRQGRCNPVAHVDRMRVKRKSIVNRLELSQLSQINMSSLDWLKQTVMDQQSKQTMMKLPPIEKETSINELKETITPTTSVPEPPPKEQKEVQKPVSKPSKVSIKDRLKKNPLFRFHYHVSSNKHNNLSYLCRYPPNKDIH